MFCPQCAAPNADGVKFCRKCGMELEGVALMLSDMSGQSLEVSGRRRESKSPNEWMEKRSTGIKEISTGVSLMIVSVLIGVAMAFFLPSRIPWILAWAVLVGWMACWGAISVGSGIAGVFDAKNRRLMGMAGSEFTPVATTDSLSPADQPPIANLPHAIGSSHPSSVTEGTTRHLDHLPEK